MVKNCLSHPIWSQIKISKLINNLPLLNSLLPEPHPHCTINHTFILVSGGAHSLSNFDHRLMLVRVVQPCVVCLPALLVFRRVFVMVGLFICYSGLVGVMDGFGFLLVGLANFSVLFLGATATW